MRLRILVMSIFLLGSTAAFAQSKQPPPDFVPVENAPAGEQIPAMPLLGAAYGFIWVAMLGYVWSLARRLQHVEAELADLESRKR
ncbi:MAG TPA: CcmD family protein [Vicinamibacterales bacterium]|nr:CcmD family protein [Vicinamibacterales bacterium]